MNGATLTQSRRRMRARIPGMICALAVLAIALLSLHGSIASAQDNTNTLRLWSDYATFRLQPASPDAFVEFYFELKRIDFKFRPVEGRLRADIYAWVHVSDTNGVPIDSVGGAFVSVVPDEAALADSNFTMFFARQMILAPGAYRANVVIADLESKATGEMTYPVRIPDYSSEMLTLSGIEFGYNIVNQMGDTTANPNDVLVKNGQKVYPDCRGLVSVLRPRLLFYSEVYNLDFDPARDNSYTMELAVEAEDGSSRESFGLQKLTKPGGDAVLTSGINIGHLAPGAYRMTIDVTDPVSGQTASAHKRFIKVAPPTDSITPEEEQRIRDIISYIARPEELNTFENLTPVGKMNFWNKFWKDRDPTPGTPENEFKTEHLERMNYANERFSVGFQNRTNGWRTDMGRAYIIYGPPDNVERYPFTPGRPAAEMWWYDNLPGQGQVYFLFVDENGYGEYNLVTSTARGERRDPDWENKINSGEFDRTQ